MEKIKVLYSGGESRYSKRAIDFMLAKVDEIELYVEIEPDEEDETGTYDELKEGIIEQAKEQGIDLGKLEFMYD